MTKLELLTPQGVREHLLLSFEKGSDESMRPGGTPRPPRHPATGRPLPVALSREDCGGAVGRGDGGTKDGLG